VSTTTVVIEPPMEALGYGELHDGQKGGGESELHDKMNGKLGGIRVQGFYRSKRGAYQMGRKNRQCHFWAQGLH
jgi:hypothetical protein